MAAENAVDVLLDRHVRQDEGDRVALRLADGRSVRYADVWAHSNRIAAALTAAGVGRRDRVVLILPDSVLLVACVFAVWRIGAIATPISTALGAGDYAAIVEDCRPAALVVSRDRAPAIERSVASTALPRRIWIADRDDLDDGGAALFGPASADVSETIEDCGWNAAALLQYTSGSTGRPKGVVHLHGALIRVADGFPSRLDLDRNDLCYSTAKMSFGYGFGNSLLFPFAVGASSLVDPEPPDPFRVVGHIAAHGPTIFFSVPSVYAAILDLNDRSADEAVRGLRHCVSAGERLGVTVFTRWKERFGLEIVEGLGATETLHIVLSATPGRITPGSVGTPVPGCRVELRTEDGATTAVGDVGLLHVQSAFNGAGYWIGAPIGAAPPGDAWISTHDLLRADAAGGYVYVGRHDQIVKVAGLKVAPLEIEERLEQHDSVRECLVVPRENAAGVVSLIAFVVLKAGWPESPAHERSLRQFVGDALAAHKRPRRVVFVPALPRTGRGKIDRRALAERAVAAGEP